MSESIIEISVQVNLSAFEQTLGQYADQVPYAASLAINNTTKDAQTAIRGHIAESFTVRRQSWVNNSIKIKPFSTKQTLTATISVDPAGGRSDILSKFEDGGVKTSQNGGKIAVPVEDTFPNKNAVIPQSKRPRNLPNSFKVIKDGKEYIYQSYGRGKNKQIRLAYVLENSTKIPNTLHFADTAIKTVNDVWSTRFDEAWDKAVSTAN